MAKIKINVYTNMNNVVENNVFFAIKNDNVIKYIDILNNKMIVDLEKDVIIRENNDYIFTMDFKINNINICMKKLKKTCDKRIKTLIIDKNKKSYLVRYLLNDENIINEYCIKF